MGCMERIWVAFMLSSALRDGFEAKWSRMKSITVLSSSIACVLLILLHSTNQTRTPPPKKNTCQHSDQNEMRERR